MVIVSVLILALFFAAVLMATATLARSFKEAQTYITPIPLLFSTRSDESAPGVELSTGTALIPGLNMTLALQHSLSGSSMSFSWAIALFSTFLYTVGALRVAALIFRNEAIRLGEQSGVDAFRAQSNADEVLPWERLWWSSGSLPHFSSTEGKESRDSPCRQVSSSPPSCSCFSRRGDGAAFEGSARGALRVSEEPREP